MMTSGGNHELRDALVRALSVFFAGLALLPVAAAGLGGAYHLELDREGLNTRATAANTVRMVGGRRGRMLVVSEFYHLPRIRLAYAVEGLEVCTVPARPRYLSRWFPLGSLIREVPAYWLYYFRSVLPEDWRTVATTHPVVGPGSHTLSHAQAHAHPSRNQRDPRPCRASLAHPHC